MSGECNICGKTGCVEMKHAKVSSLWRPSNGCYGKIHLVVDGISLCGKEGEWFDIWRDEPDVTCTKCRRIAGL